MSLVLQEARRTLALAGPIIVGQVSQMLMGVTDSVMIGHVGKVPLAASAFANSVFGFFFVVGLGLLMSVAVLVSRAHGARRDDECADWLRHGLALAFAYCAGATVLMLALGSRLDLFRQPAEVLAEVHPYFELITLSLLPVLGFQVFRQYAESLGRAVLPMVIMLLSVALNVVLNWILIYGNLGAPALGLAGAGYATLISRLASWAVIFLWLRSSPAFATTWPTKQTARYWFRGLSRKRFAGMLHLGVPASGSLMFEVGAFTAAALMMGWISATALAAHQIALSCAGFTFMFPLGLAMAASMRLARAIGEERRDVLRPIAFGAHAMSAVIMIGFAIVFVVGGPMLAAGFVEEPDVIALAAKLLVVAGIFQLFDGGQVVGVSALRGLSDVKIPTAITAVAYWGISLPAGYWLGVRGPAGAVGVWAALAAALGVAAVSLLWRFIRLTRPTAIPDTTVAVKAQGSAF
jgi:multidrug resistance protein, MATE family